MTAGLLDAARQCGYEALMVTVDVPVGGKRERASTTTRDPLRFTHRNVLDSPRARYGASTSCATHAQLENVAGLAPEAKSTAEIAPRSGQFWDADFDWDDLKAMRDKWPGKMLVRAASRDEAERIAFDRWTRWSCQPRRTPA